MFFAEIVRGGVLVEPSIRSPRPEKRRSRKQSRSRREGEVSLDLEEEKRFRHPRAHRFEFCVPLQRHCSPPRTGRGACIGIFRSFRRPAPCASCTCPAPASAGSLRAKIPVVLSDFGVLDTQHLVLQGHTHGPAGPGFGNSRRSGAAAAANLASENAVGAGGTVAVEAFLRKWGLSLRWQLSSKLIF